MIRIPLAVAAMIASASVALAADLAGPLPTGPVASFAPDAAFDWTGFYVGAHAGYGWSGNDWRLIDNAGGGACGQCGTVVTSFDEGGALGGLQVGYNRQFGRFVVGGEIEASLAGIAGEGLWTANGGAEFRSADLELDWLVAVGPRVGYAFDRVFVYAKGGLAVAQEQYRHQNLFNGNTFSDEDIRAGFFAGTGVEYAISDNWSARVEYQYVDLGDERVSLTGPTGTAVFDVDQSIHVVKAGVNYRF